MIDTISFMRGNLQSMFLVQKQKDFISNTKKTCNKNKRTSKSTIIIILYIILTSALYTILGVKHLFSKEHSTLLLQIHPYSILLEFNICLLCDDVIDLILFNKTILEKNKLNQWKNSSSIIELCHNIKVLCYL